MPSRATSLVVRRGAPGLPRLPWLTGLLLLGLVLLSPSSALAHATGENYVWLNIEKTHLEGRFEILLDDLRSKLDIEVPDIEGLEDEEAARLRVAETAPQVERYLEAHFEVLVDGEKLPYTFSGTGLVEAPGLGHFAQYFYRTAERAIPDQLTIRNNVLVDTDRFHRSLLCIEYDRRQGKDYGGEFTALIFSASNAEQTLDLSDVRGLLRVREFIWQGVLHIWIGIDHVLFLVALLLTAVLVRRPPEEGQPPPRGLAAWQPIGKFKSALWNIVKIVTVFTVAHSVTLSLAALDLIHLPSRVVESIIALSIVLVAINNLSPRLRDRDWVIIFFFGLFHGMGFASVMGDLPFRMMHLVQVILAFNIGVELGQVVIVAAVFPVLFLLRRSAYYKPVVLTGGSVVIALVASWWFVERAFGL